MADLSAKKKQTAVINGVTVEFSDFAQKFKLTNMFKKLDKIPTGKKALADLAEKKTVVSIDGISGFGFFVPNENRVVLSNSAPEQKLVSTLVHEACHMMQHENGCNKYDRNDLDVKSQIMLDRAKEADAQVKALTACFEWAAAGDQKPFQAFQSNFPQICTRYATQRREQGFAQDSEQAKAEMFKGWYEQDAVRQTYEFKNMNEKAAVELADTLETDKTAGDYTKPRKRESLTAEQVLDMVGADYMKKDVAFLISENALSVMPYTKELLSLAFDVNGRKDASLNELPEAQLFATSMNLNVITSGALGNAQRRGEAQVTSALGLTAYDEKKAFFEKPAAEQNKAVEGQDKEVKDALRRVQALQAVYKTLDSSVKIANDKMLSVYALDDSKKVAAAERVASEQENLKANRKAVVAFAHRNSPIMPLMQKSMGR